jgi:hypothetical protein
VRLGATEDPERVIALVASELLLASWAELLVQKEPAAAAAPPAAVVVRRAVEQVARPVLRPKNLEIDVQAVGHERHLSSPVTTLGAAVRAGQSGADPWHFFAALGIEAGAAERAPGRVLVAAGALGLGLRWDAQLGGAQFGVLASASATYVSLQGIPSTSAARGTTYGGLTADFSLGCEASAKLQSVRLGGGLSGGAAAPGPVGLVEQGAPVRFEGPWVGATLFAGLLL